MRRITTFVRVLLNDIIERLASFYTNIALEFQKFYFEEAAILNIDESALYLEMQAVRALEYSRRLN